MSEPSGYDRVEVSRPNAAVRVYSIALPLDDIKGLSTGCESLSHVLRHKEKTVAKKRAAAKKAAKKAARR